jgi:hypothetical protein
MELGRDPIEEPERPLLAVLSSGASCLPNPAASACDESVRVTVWILLLAVDAGTEALGAWRGRSPAMFLVCCGEPCIWPELSFVSVFDRSSKLAYSLPSSPSPGREVLGGREGTSRGLGGGPFPYGLLRGEGANVSLFGLGETERSPRLGRGGILGASSWEAGAELFCPRAGRGGIEGGALIFCVEFRGDAVWGQQIEETVKWINVSKRAK